MNMFMEYVKDLIQKHQSPILKKTRVETQKGNGMECERISCHLELSLYLTQEEQIIKRRFIDERYNQQLLRVDVEDPTKPLDYDLPEEK